MNMHPSRAIALLCVLAAAPAAAQTSSPFQTPMCPLPAETAGYPVWARAADGGALDARYAEALADAVARRWEPPSPGRRGYPGLERLSRRIQPPEPRWPQDWAPGAGDTARVAVTLFRGAPAGAPLLLSASGNRAFDRSVAAHFREPAPASPALPPLPEGADSVRVEIGFGTEPAPGAGLVRFAAQQAPARLTPNTLRIPPQPSRTGQRVSQATIKYDIDVSGRVIPGTIEILGTGNRTFAQSIADGLAIASATPAVSNCRPIASSVVQFFQAR